MICWERRYAWGGWCGHAGEILINTVACPSTASPSDCVGCWAWEVKSDTLRWACRVKAAPLPLVLCLLTSRRTPVLLYSSMELCMVLKGMLRHYAPIHAILFCFACTVCSTDGGINLPLWKLCNIVHYNDYLVHHSSYKYKYLRELFPRGIRAYIGVLALLGYTRRTINTTNT